MNKSSHFAGPAFASPIAEFGARAGKRDATTLNTFNIVILLIVAAVVITAYISNTFKVDKLLMQITQREKEEQRLVQDQENIRAEINILSSYDNIYRKASTELGLVRSGMQPYQLIVPNLPETSEPGD